MTIRIPRVLPTGLRPAVALALLAPAAAWRVSGVVRPSDGAVLDLETRVAGTAEDGCRPTGAVG